MKLSKVHLAVLALISTSIIWGAAYPIYKWSLQDIEPFTFVFLRFFIAALIIIPFAAKSLHIDKADYKKLVGASLAGVSLTVSFWFFGLLLAPSINAPIIGASGPIFILIFAWFFLHEKLKTKTIVGTVISLLGVVFILIQPFLQHTVNGSFVGNLFFILATLCGVIHTVLVKQLAAKYNLLALTFWTFLIGSIAIMPLALYETYRFGFLQDISAQGLFGIGYGAIFSAAAAYSLLAFGLKYIKANEAGIFAYIEPIIAALVALPLLGEEITSTYLLGAILVFLGISIAETKFPHHHYHRMR